MSGKSNRLPPGSWTPEPLELLESDAWRSAGINTRRLIDFLKREHMRHGGKENGQLKAPRRQLEAYGIGTHQVSEAIREAEKLGLVQVQRRGMRTASTYTLTCLHDGSSGSWRAYRNPNLARLPTPKSRNLTAKRQSALTVKQQSDGPNLTAKQQSDGPKNLTAKQQHLSRKDLTKGRVILGMGPR